MSKQNTVAEELKRRIRLGVYHPGEKLPGEILLAEELGISRVTLRTALKRLINEGLIESFGRSGNYVSNKIGGKTYLCICHDHPDELTIPEQHLVPSLRYELLTSGHRLNLLSAKQLKDTTPEEWNRMLTRYNIAGVFLLPTGNEKACELFNSTRVPIIKVLCRSAARDFFHFPAVTVASPHLILDGTRYLASLGHKRICTIFAKNDRRGLELKDYKDFLRYNGLCDDDRLILHTQGDTKQQARDILLGPEPPTAFMCFCDAKALKVYEAAKELGISIPQQLSVMGICGYSERLFAWPKLGVVNFHYDRISAETVKLMLRAEEWFGTPEQANITVIVPHTIESNGSVGEPFENAVSAGLTDLYNKDIRAAE